MDKRADYVKPPRRTPSVSSTISFARLGGGVNGFLRGGVNVWEFLERSGGSLICCRRKELRNPDNDQGRPEDCRESDRGSDSEQDLDWW